MPAILNSEKNLLKVIGKGQGHSKISKNGASFKIIIYKPNHEKWNAYYFTPWKQSAPPSWNIAQGHRSMS